MVSLAVCLICSSPWPFDHVSQCISSCSCSNESKGQSKCCDTQEKSDLLAKFCGQAAYFDSLYRCLSVLSFWCCYIASTLFLFQAVASINTLLDKADHQYKLLQERKTALETLMVSISDHSSDSSSASAGPAQPTGGSTTASTTSSTTSSASAINKNIQMLAQKYCTDCRNAFEELSKIIQVASVQTYL